MYNMPLSPLVCAMHRWHALIETVLTGASMCYRHAYAHWTLMALLYLGLLLCNEPQLGHRRRQMFGTLERILCARACARVCARARVRASVRASVHARACVRGVLLDPSMK